MSGQRRSSSSRNARDRVNRLQAARLLAPTPAAAAKEAARAKAESLRAEIRAGGDFERVAKRESMDAATKELGGDLGWRKRGDLPIELERLLFGTFAIKQGEVSQVVESPFGYHLLRLDRAQPPVEVKVRQILIIPPIDSTDVVRARPCRQSRRRAAPGSFVRYRRATPSRSRRRRARPHSRTAFDSLPASYQAGLRATGRTRSSSSQSRRRSATRSTSSPRWPSLRAGRIHLR